MAWMTGSEALDIAVALNGGRPFPNRLAAEDAVRRLLVAANKRPVPAHRDRAGNCPICGEAGRCPGWHTIEERREADARRAAWEAERQPTLAMA